MFDIVCSTQLNIAQKVGWINDEAERDDIEREYELNQETARQAEVADQQQQLQQQSTTSSGKFAATSFTHGSQKQSNPNPLRNSKEKLRPGEARADKERSKALNSNVQVIRVTF